MSRELKFVSVDENDFQRNCALFGRPSNPIGEVRLKSTGTLISKHYVLSADKISQFDVREDDIWVISFPRSGTTWLEEMIWLLNNDLNFEKAQTQYLSKRFMFLELLAKNKHFKGAAEFDDLDSINNAPSPRHIKSHLPLELLPKQLMTVKPKIFYIYRNPKDVAVSQYYFFQMIHHFKGTFDDFAELFVAEKMTYQPYWNHVLGFWELTKTYPNIKMVFYEEMNENLVDVIQNISNFLEKSCTRNETEKLSIHLNFESMKNNKSLNKEEQMLRNNIVGDPKNVQFLRKGTTNQWKIVMNPRIIKMFDQWSEKYLDCSDFTSYQR